MIVTLLVFLLERRKERDIGIDPLMQQQNMTVGNMTVGKSTYSCHNKHNKLVDSLKQNLKKI